MNNEKTENRQQVPDSEDEIVAAGEVETIVEPADSGLEELEAALAEAQADLEKHKDVMLRQQAEFQNARTRAAREIDKARKFALEDIMKELLPVQDTFQRGLEVENASAEALRQGSELTLKMLQKVLQKFGLEEIDPREEQFNPDLHEAVSMVPMEGVESGRIIEVIQKGYRLHDRLIRAAMVVVAK